MNACSGKTFLKRFKHLKGFGSSDLDYWMLTFSLFRKLEGLAHIVLLGKPGEETGLVAAEEKKELYTWPQHHHLRLCMTQMWVTTTHQLKINDL